MRIFKLSYARTRVIMALAILATGCAKGSGSSDTAVTCGSKALKSSWTSPSLSFSFSLANLTLNQNNTFLVTFSGSRSCTGTLNMTGSDCGGTYTISGSTWTGTGVSDPGCSSLNETGTYAKSDAGLTFTKTGNSTGTTYQ